MSRQIYLRVLLRKLFSQKNASRTYYEIESNKFARSGLISDTDILPDRRRMTKHSFWMTKQLIKEILQNKWS